MKKPVFSRYFHKYQTDLSSEGLNYNFRLLYADYE